MSTLAALRHQEFRLLFAGYAAAGLGQWMQQFALGWLVVQIAMRDGNIALAGLYLGVMRLVGAVPALGIGLFAGVLADRMDRRTLLIRARIASSVVAIGLALHVASGVPDLATVILFAAANIGAFAFDNPARQAMISTIVPRDALVSAIGLSRASIQLAQTVGPFVGGLVVIPFGVSGVFYAKAALDVVSVLFLLLMRPAPVGSGEAGTRILGALGEGVAHVAKDEILRWTIVMLAVGTLFVNSVSQLLPVLAVALGGGAVEVSWMLAAFGIGALAGTVVIASSDRSGRRRGLLLLVSLMVTGAVLALLGLQHSILGAIVVLIGLGVGHQITNGTQAVILQIAAPERLRARIVGLQPVIITAGTPLGVFLVGMIGGFTGISNALTLAGLSVVAISLVALLRLDGVRRLRLDPAVALARPEIAAARTVVGAE